MSKKTIAMLHPGEMGAAIGAGLLARGHRVLWALAGRGGASRERAEDSGLEDAGTLARAVREAEIVFSVCPPHAARDLARFEAAGLPAGFHLAAADIYRRLEEFKDAAPPMDEVKAALLRRS